MKLKWNKSDVGNICTQMREKYQIIYYAVNSYKTNDTLQMVKGNVGSVGKIKK